MHDAADAVRRPMLLDERKRVVPGLARVNDDRLFGLSRDCHLLR